MEHPGESRHQAPGTARRHLAPGTAPGTRQKAPGTDTGGRPLLKWAGGKRQLLPALRSFYPEHFRRYFEPFLGSGAVFFDLHASGRLQGRRATLTDSNLDLIGCYEMVRDHTADVATALARLARGHRAEGAAHFYRVRERFNRLRQRQAVAGERAYTPALAAMLIYLNRTGFNGLFRLNGDGEFNVPVGRYVRPRIFDPVHLARVAAALQPRNVRLVLAPFQSVLREVRSGDFVYFDPPYAPLSATARFTSYTSRQFTLSDHARLCDVAVRLAERGCFVMVSNSSAPEVATMYQDNPRVTAAGLVVHRLPARRAINSRASARGPVTEFLLTNLEPRMP